MTEAAKKYVAYYRVSTKEQGESGLGLDSQCAIVRHFAKNDKIIAEYVEVKSGGSLEGRVELRAAIDHAKRENATLIIAKADRLSRNVIDALTVFDELNENIKCCDMPSETSRFMLTMIFAFAEHERLLISVRTKAALDAKKQRESKEIINGGGLHKKKRLFIIEKDGLKFAYCAKEDLEEKEVESKGRFLGSFSTIEECRESFQNYIEDKKRRGNIESCKVRSETAKVKQSKLVLICKQFRKDGKSLGEIAALLKGFGYKSNKNCELTATHVYRMLKLI